VSGPGALAFALEPAAWSDLRAGRWQRATVAASEGLALGRDLGISTLIATFAALHAQIDAGRGDEQSARAHADEALALADVQGLALVEQWARYALGLLELGLGRFDSAQELLAAVARRMAEMELFYRDVVPEPDLVELHARRGELTEARAWLEAWNARGGPSGSAWFAAVEARCNGIVAEEERFEAHFDQALAAQASAPDRFAEARTRLAFGERLRRAARRVDAREQLRSALALLDELGAEPWAERARAELRASGETLRRRESDEDEELTPQELQIALQVAEGKTNKEVGAALFLSPKTIEFHLKRVFRKLGVRSRGELIKRFATSPPA
jgi:DNA-binding CsgD family transcriptional regulator